MLYDKVLQENIEFSELEERIVNLEEFQRLKFIKQNGFSYILYPTATNNRFDHSIGTMYWATQLYKSIVDRESSLESDDLQALRLAALVHDIGHGPFSHALEMLFDRNPELKSHEPWSGFIKNYGDRKPHELLTLKFIDSKVFEKLIPSKIRPRVSKILKKQSPLTLLISGDLDADRLDYLTRDSRHSGLPFGFNVKPIFNQLIQQNLQIKKLDSNYFLLIDSKGIPAFEQLLVARYAHYYYIAYERRILSVDLVFVSELEKSLWEQIKKEDQVALAVFYLFTGLTDDKMLDLDFSDFDKEKRKLLDMIKTPSISKTFKDLKRSQVNLNSNFIRLSYLGKMATFNFFKSKTADIKELEDIVSGYADQPVKMYFCLPQVLTTRTCVFDKDIKEEYSPSLVYDYSPIVRALEQKMYLDCGIIFSSVKPISREKLVKIFDKITRGKTDFDMYTYAILNYIKRVQQFFPREERKWKLRRSRIFEFLHAFMEAFLEKGKIEKRIDFKMPWYSVEVYELLQKLEFLDVLDEDFNLSIVDGFIPCYVYSIGEYGEELLESLKLTKEEKYEIEMFVEGYIRGKDK